MLKTNNSVHTPTPPRDHFLRQNSPSPETSPAGYAELSRYHEENTPSKRRKLNGDLKTSPLEIKKGTDNVLNNGPFLDVSDDDELVNVLSSRVPADTQSPETHSTLVGKSNIDMEGNMSNDAAKSPSIPVLKREPTSVEQDEFEGMNEFFEDEFPEEGEEYLERRWMEEQRQFEMEFEDAELEDKPELKGESGETGAQKTRNEETATCPICNMAFNGLTDQVG